jgi:hypothetical protein
VAWSAPCRAAAAEQTALRVLNPETTVAALTGREVVNWRGRSHPGAAPDGAAAVSLISSKRLCRCCGSVALCRALGKSRTTGSCVPSPVGTDDGSIDRACHRAVRNLTVQATSVGGSDVEYVVEDQSVIVDSYPEPDVFAAVADLDVGDDGLAGTERFGE